MGRHYTPSAPLVTQPEQRHEQETEANAETTNAEQGAEEAKTRILTCMFCGKYYRHLKKHEYYCRNRTHGTTK